MFSTCSGMAAVSWWPELSDRLYSVCLCKWWHIWDSTTATDSSFSRSRIKTYNSHLYRIAYTKLPKPQFLKISEESQNIFCNSRFYGRSENFTFILLLWFIVGVFVPAIWNSGSYQQCLKYILAKRSLLLQGSKAAKKTRHSVLFGGKAWLYGGKGEKVFQEGIL